jgi:hypothetical protein
VAPRLGAALSRGVPPATWLGAALPRGVPPGTARPLPSWRGAASCPTRCAVWPRRAAMAAQRVVRAAVAPCSARPRPPRALPPRRGSVRPRPGAVVVPLRGAAPAQRGPGTARPRLARPWCPCTAWPLRGAAPCSLARVPAALGTTPARRDSRHSAGVARGLELGRRGPRPRCPARRVVPCHACDEPVYPTCISYALSVPFISRS